MPEATTTLLYIADPMCSWCWGFAPQLRQVEREFPELPVRIVVGGLAPDTEDAMPEEMRRYVQQAWDAVERRTGVSFNREFWNGSVLGIQRSTYPACRAVITARKVGKERAMFDAIQQAYYMEARNPSDKETLMEIAAGIGMESETFLAQLDSPATQAELEEDFRLRRSLDANTFPSLALRGPGIPGDGMVLLRGYATAEEMIAFIQGKLV